MAKSALRYTPAGIPVAELSLRHDGAVAEAGYPGGRTLRGDPAARRPGVPPEIGHQTVGGLPDLAPAPQRLRSADEKAERHERTAHGAAHAPAAAHALGEGGGQREGLVIVQTPAQAAIERDQNGLRAVHLPGRK